MGMEVAKKLYITCCCMLTENGGTQPSVVLSHNESERFESRFVTVRINDSPSIMLAGMQNSVLGVWVAHGEGTSSVFTVLLILYGLPFDCL